MGERIGGSCEKHTQANNLSFFFLAGEEEERTAAAATTTSTMTTTTTTYVFLGVAESNGKKFVFFFFIQKKAKPFLSPFFRLLISVLVAMCSFSCRTLLLVVSGSAQANNVTMLHKAITSALGKEDNFC